MRTKRLSVNSTKQQLHFFCLSFLLCLGIGVLQAQDNLPQKLIDIKQRLLRPKSFNADLRQEIDSNSTLHLMIAGNLYQTEKHVNYCFDEEKGKYNFREELKYIQPILSLGDLTIANLKTAFANDENNMFTSPDEFALALKYSGINVLVHANNHTAQVDKATLKRTRDMLYSYEMYHTGAFTDGMQRNGNYPLIINKKGFRIAVLNYTSLNTRPSISRDFIINEFDKSLIERDMRVARINKPDFIIVYFDWGTNNQDIPSAMQKDLAQFCFNQGANLVVGTLPNTPLSLDYMTYNQNGQLREGIVAYSLGSLISSNDEVRNRNGYVIDMELKKNNFNGETTVGDWGVIPVYTYYDTISAPGKTKVLSMSCSAVENGDILTKLPYIEKRRVINGAYEVRKLLGATADEIQYNMTELTANNVMETIDLTRSALNNRYNQKKESDIKPSAAPVLPVATVGSNNPPSLASIFGEAKPINQNKAQALIIKNNTSTSTTAIAATSKADSVFANTNLTLPATATRVETDSASPMAITNSIQTSSSTISAQEDSISRATITAQIIAEKTIENSSPIKSESSSTSENATRAKQTASIADDEMRRKKSNAPVVEDDPQRKKSTARALEDDIKKKQTETVVFYDDVKEEKPRAVYYEGDKVETGREKSTELTRTSEAQLPISLGRVTERTVNITVDTFYRVQIYALQKFIPLDTNYYTHLKGYEVVEEDGLFKYLLGKYRLKEQCEKFWKEQILPRYKTSFVVPFIDGKRKFE